MLKSHGITAETPKNLMFSAGAYYKNLQYGEHYSLTAPTTEGALKVVASGASGGTDVDLATVTPTCPEAKANDYVLKETGFYGTILGATSGGGTLSITPEYLDAELDGATVKVKGAKNKVGEAAQMEINLTEIKEGIFVDALHLVKDENAQVTGYVKYVTKAQIDDDDYLENIAFVGLLNDGRRVICIMHNALCTSAMELATANKTQATFAATFECHADFEQEDLMHVPVDVYFPTATV